MTLDVFTGTPAMWADVPTPRTPSEPASEPASGPLIEVDDDATVAAWDAATYEPRDPDPVVAETQNHRDRMIATGQWDYAEQAQARIDLWRVDPLAGLPALDYTPDPPEPG